MGHILSRSAEGRSGGLLGDGVYGVLEDLAFGACHHRILGRLSVLNVFWPTRAGIKPRSDTGPTMRRPLNIAIYYAVLASFRVRHRLVADGLGPRDRVTRLFTGTN
jgi:hypothetical protein